MEKPFPLGQLASTSGDSHKLTSDLTHSQSLNRPVLDDDVGSSPCPNSQLSQLAIDPSVEDTLSTPYLFGMLIVLPVPLRQQGNRFLFDLQACNGLERWADNFGSVVVAAPVMPEDLAEQDTTIAWRDVATLENPQRFSFLPLPWAYSLKDFVANYGQVRSLLAETITRCRYLQFGISWLIGDWAAVAAIEAQRHRRSYAVHKDLVDHKVILQASRDGSLKQRIKALITSPIVASYHRWLIQRCQLGLWHGADCYTAYGKLCQNSYLIHDVHTKAADQIGELALQLKRQQVTQDPVLRICYVGRMVPMKAPLDWLLALASARKLGVKFQATWVGDGSMRQEMEEMIEATGLGSCVHLPGFESNRDRLLQHLRDAHVMVFTHITQESPRCLIEALQSGTPLIGYDSEYASDLVQGSVAGAFVPVGEWQALAQLLYDVDRDRPLLSERIGIAASQGTRFSDDSVFRERSELIKTHLTV